MSTCGTCKFFGTEQRRHALDERKCSVYIPSGFHECLLIKMDERYSKYPKIAPACVVDGSDYYAALCVKEEFGCNQWEDAP